MVYLRYVTHFYHKNITRGVSNWDNIENSTRDFNTIEEMTDSIVKGINSCVKEDDILFHLGDWSFGGIDKILEARKRINCTNIYLIAGNHDLHIIQRKLITLANKNKLAANLLFDYKGTSDLIQIDNTLIYMSHFPTEDVRFDKKSIHLHGHKHGTINEANETTKRLDVGIDSYFKMFGKYQPFNWQEIKDIINGR